MKDLTYREWLARLEAGEVIDGLHICSEYVGVHQADHGGDDS